MRNVFRCILIVPILMGLATAASADAQKGLAAYDVGDYETALAECLPAAEAGDVNGQFCVGQMYANGFGVMMNDDEALKWYGLAAAAGHAEAQFNLAVMHANGWGVPMDGAEAARLYRLSADQGFLPAINGLAYVLANGLGVAENDSEAFKYYEIAAGLGDFGANSKRDDLKNALGPDEIAAAHELAMSWLEAHEEKTLQAGTLE